MTLYLTSSPCVIGADRAILTAENGFLFNLKRDIPMNAKCLYIPADPCDDSNNTGFCTDMVVAFREAGIVFSEMKLLDANTPEDASKMVQWSDFVILGGGHVPTQNAYFSKIGLRQILSGYPGVVMGISAGSMNCAAMVYAQPEVTGESIDPSYDRFLPGLGLTFLNVLPHYQQVKDHMLDGKRLYEDITYADSSGHCFLVLPDGSYVISHEGQSWLYGKAYQLEDGILHLICEDSCAMRL